MRIPIKLLFFSLTCINSYGQDDIQIKELNPASFVKEFKEYDTETALYCGQLSEIVYWNEKDIKERFDRINETYPDSKLNISFIENKKTHSQALLWCSKDFLVISFRGTEPSKIRDLFTDSKFWNYRNNPSQNETLVNMPIGHGGFRKSLISIITENDLFEKIDEVIKKSNSDADLTKFPIYLTGHSLGAALSQLFIECLNYKNYNFSGAYHFAPPLVVSCSLNYYMRKSYGDIVYDIVNYKDYIPRAGRRGVAHFGKFYRICIDNLIYKEPDAYVRFSKKEYFMALKYHKLNNHLISIRDKQNSNDNIIFRSIEQFPCMGDNIQYIDPCSQSKN